MPAENGGYLLVGVVQALDASRTLDADSTDSPSP